MIAYASTTQKKVEVYLVRNLKRLRNGSVSAKPRMYFRNESRKTADKTSMAPIIVKTSGICPKNVICKKNAKNAYFYSKQMTKKIFH